MTALPPVLTNNHFEWLAPQACYIEVLTDRANSIGVLHYALSASIPSIAYLFVKRRLSCLTTTHTSSRHNERFLQRRGSYWRLRQDLECTRKGARSTRDRLDTLPRSASSRSTARSSC